MPYAPWACYYMPLLILHNPKPPIWQLNALPDLVGDHFTSQTKVGVGRICIWDIIFHAPTAMYRYSIDTLRTCPDAKKDTAGYGTVSGIAPRGMGRGKSRRENAPTGHLALPNLPAYKTPNEPKLSPPPTPHTSLDRKDNQQNTHFQTCKQPRSLPRAAVHSPLPITTGENLEQKHTCEIGKQ